MHVAYNWVVSVYVANVSTDETMKICPCFHSYVFIVSTELFRFLLL